MAAVDAEVVAFAVSPFLALYSNHSKRRAALGFDKLAGGGSVDVLSLAHCLDAVVDVGGDEDVNHILNHAAHSRRFCPQNAVALIGSLSDGVALELYRPSCEKSL